MSPRTLRSSIRSLPLFLVLFSSALAPAGASETPRWTLRLRALASDYKHQYVFSYMRDSRYLDLEGGDGFEAAVELRPGTYVGWELSAARLDFDARLRDTFLELVSIDPFLLQEVTRFSARGTFGVDPLSVGVLVHPFPRNRFDLYVGPQIAWVRFRVDVPRGDDRDPEFAWGVKLGGDLRLGESPWALGLELRHLEVLHEIQDRDLYGNMRFNLAALSIAYRFGASR